MDGQHLALCVSVQYIHGDLLTYLFISSSLGGSFDQVCHPLYVFDSKIKLIDI